MDFEIYYSTSIHKKEISRKIIRKFPEMNLQAEGYIINDDKFDLTILYDDDTPSFEPISEYFDRNNDSYRIILVVKKNANKEETLTFIVQLLSLFWANEIPTFIIGNNFCRHLPFEGGFRFKTPPWVLVKDL